jgi:hypothetical protein
MRESTIEHYLRAQVRAAGGVVRKVRWLDRNGAPDRLVLLPVNRAVWVELKAPGEAPEAHQSREHERMRARGLKVVVIDSLDGVDTLVRGA